MSIAVEPGATRVAATIGDKEISFETGAVAKQAHGAVLVQQGDTVVLATAVGRTEGREGADFFPLTVDVEEKMYAAGKIPGGFFKREGRAGEKAILNARMVDRPDPAAVAEGLQERGADHRHHVLGRHGERPRHPRHQRRLGRADALADALPGPGRGRAHRPPGRRAGGQPDPARAEGVEPRPDRVRHARGDHDGRGRRAGDRRGGSDRRARARPRRDQEAVPDADRPRGQGRPAQVGRRRRHRVASPDARRSASGRHQRGRAGRASADCRRDPEGRDARGQRQLDRGRPAAAQRARSSHSPSWSSRPASRRCIRRSRSSTATPCAR